MSTLLVDGNNLLARSAFAAKGGRTQMSVDGINTSALLIFINLMSKYVREVEPTHMAVCWDAGHALRDAIHPGYKANRGKAVVEEEDEVITPWVQAKEFLTWAGIPHLARRGWEADDLIAKICLETPAEHRPVVILSGDKDLLQLVDRDVTQIRPGTGGLEMWDVARIRKEMSLHPAQIPIYMALTGDAGDCQPVGTRVLVRTKASRPAPNRALTDEQVGQIRARLASGESQSSLAREFGVSTFTVHSIHHGRAYGEDADGAVYQWVPIESVGQGDRVVSRTRQGEWATRAVTKTRTMPAPSTPMVTVDTAGGRASSYTASHRCMVKVNHFGGEWLVYLMQKGDSFRIGLSRCTSDAGPRCRMGDEDGDAIWVLSAHSTEGEARLAEQLASWQYGLPDVRFRGADWVHDFWAKMGDLTGAAERCLSDHGRMLRYPLYSRGCPPIWGNRLSEIRACNLMPGMEVLCCEPENDSLPRRGGSVWDSISSVRREWLGAPVVALEVEDTGLYVSDGMLTHNSVPGVRGIGPKKALALLERTEFEWDALLAELGEDKAREAIMSRRLVDLRYPEFAAYGDDVIGVLTNLSAPAFAPTAAGGMLWEPLQDFLKKWSMNTVIQRLTDGTLWFTGGPTGSAEDLFASFGP